MSYDFSISALLEEAFKRTNGVKLIFIGSISIYVIIGFFVNQTLAFIFPHEESSWNFYAASVLEAVFTIPLLVGINMLAVKYARGDTLLIPSIFDYYPMIIQLMMAYLAMTALILTGMILLVLPAIYLVISYVFTYTLMVDKKLDMWDAMELSRKTVTKQWFKFFTLALISGIILLLGVLTLGVGLIWALPTVYIAYGMLYHRLFDEEDEA